VKILITGSFKGIGKTVYEQLSLSHEVYGIDKQMGDTVDIVHDLNDLTTLDKVLESLPVMDVIIHNAAFQGSEPFETLSLDVVKEAMQVNLYAGIKLSQWMAKQESHHPRKLIFISSTRARMSEKDTVPYTVSKAALEGLTHALAITLSEKQITVNAVAPGWIHTTDEPLKEEEHAFHPSKRVGKPLDIYKAIAYIIDPDNTFLNGETITVDGGVTKKMIYPE